MPTADLWAHLRQMPLDLQRCIWRRAMAGPLLIDVRLAIGLRPGRLQLNEGFRQEMIDFCLYAAYQQRTTGEVHLRVGKGEYTLGEGGAVYFIHDRYYGVEHRLRAAWEGDAEHRADQPFRYDPEDFPELS